MNEIKKNSNQQTCLIPFKWRDHALFNERKNIIHGFIEIWCSQRIKCIGRLCNDAITYVTERPRWSFNSSRGRVSTVGGSWSGWGCHSVCWSVGLLAWGRGAWRTSTINLSPTLATFPLGLRSRFPSFLGSSTLPLDPSLAISFPLSVFLSSFFDPRKEGPFSERRGDKWGLYSVRERETEREKERERERRSW